VPSPVALGAARVAGSMLAAIPGDRRRMVERHLARAEGRPLGRFERRRLVAEAFESYARYWVEALRLPSVPEAALRSGMTASGVGHIRRALAGGRGAILALPHLGGWDYGGAWLATQGFPITVVVEPLEPPELFEWFASFRRSLGMTVVPLGPSATSEVLRALRANHVVGLLCDRDVGASGVEVEFFGEVTTLPAGPVTLSLRTGAPVLPTAVYFRGPSGHHGVVRPPLALVRGEGRLRDAVSCGMRQLAAELEALIRAEPTQWHLMQPNWPSDRVGAGQPERAMAPPPRRS
jgi:KDO2-lipid IV(A) lauroyltransferase